MSFFYIIRSIIHRSLHDGNVYDLNMSGFNLATVADRGDVVK